MAKSIHRGLPSGLSPLPNEGLSEFASVIQNDSSEEGGLRSLSELGGRVSMSL
jgi:hypothetical protein